MKRYHSRDYHSFFEDYAEKEIYDDQGNRHIERVYVGFFYRRKVSDGANMALKLLYASVLAASLLIFIFAGTRNIVFNQSILGAILITISLMAIVILILPVATGIAAPRKMMIRTFRSSSEKLQTLAVAASFLTVVDMAGCLLFTFLYHTGTDSEFFSAILGYLISAVLLAVLKITEKKIIYEELPPENERPAKTPIIKY